jgi:hypothetical protein
MNVLWRHRTRTRLSIEGGHGIHQLIHFFCGQSGIGGGNRVNLIAGIAKPVIHLHPIIGADHILHQVIAIAAKPKLITSDISEVDCVITGCGRIVIADTVRSCR